MGWWARLFLRRRHAAPGIDPVLWAETLRAWPLFAGLKPDEQGRLRTQAEILLREKAFVGAQGLQVTESMRVQVAALAALPILNLSPRLYRGWRTLVLYPDTFVVTQEAMDEAGVLHRWQEARSGEAWPHGALILAWGDVQASRSLPGFNPVVHEFVHKLDMHNGAADGFPRLHADMVPERWTQVWQGAFDRVCGLRGDEPEAWVDPYAGENPAEFFAVMSEYFFECPTQLRGDFPELYAQLAAYYRQDPVARQLPATAADLRDLH